MTINYLTSKLRKHHYKDYSLLFFCLSLSISLISSFALMCFSSTIQEILPTGGDSRKQVMLIFGIAIAGCGIFTTYASTLFFKTKSYEIGTFLALGEKKRKIRNRLFKDLLIVTCVGGALGLFSAIPLSFGIWKIFQIFIVDTKEMIYQFSSFGFLFGLVFCVIVSAMMFITGVLFIKHNDIIDFIKKSRTNEVVKISKPYLGKLGWILLVVGLISGYYAPGIVIDLGYWPTGIVSVLLNMLFLIALVGVYFIMYHAIVNGKWKKGTKRYYQNIIAINMMRFSGKKTVKNMCVITFLLAGGTFAAFYTPVNLTASLYNIDMREYDNSFYYRNDQLDMLTEEDISSTANEHEVKVKDYMEIESIQLLIDGNFSDWIDNFEVTEYREIRNFEDFISVTDYNKITGQEITVNDGEFYFIEQKFTNHSEVTKITHPITQEQKNLIFMGTVNTTAISFPFLNVNVISDNDYRYLTKDMSDMLTHTFVLFNTENPSYAFEKGLTKEIVDRSSQDVAIGVFYDHYEKFLAEEKGDVYFYNMEDNQFRLSSDDNNLFRLWKYYPQFNILNNQDMIKNMAVFLMLFIYMSIICLVSVGVITYTRGITIGIENKQLFEDLKRLGANEAYIKNCIKKQLSKIFLYPSVVGCTLTYSLFVMIMYANNGMITPDEWMALVINAGITVIVFLAMFLVYKLTFNKVFKMIND